MGPPTGHYNSTMSLILLGWGVAVLGFSACSDPSQSGLNGAFEGYYPAPVNEYQYLGLSLAESNGSVSGTAFYSYTPGYAGSVTGTFDGKEFDLQIRDVYFGGNDLRYFRGQIEGNTLTGELGLSGYDGAIFQASRTELTATGRSRSTYEGALAETREGPTDFAPIGTLAFTLAVGRFPGLGINWLSPQRPGEGRFEFGGQSPAGMMRIPSEGGAMRAFPIQSGWIEIDVSQRFVLQGRFDVQGRESGGSESLRVRGSFSAGCSVPSC